MHSWARISARVGAGDHAYMLNDPKPLAMTKYQSEPWIIEQHTELRAEDIMTTLEEVRAIIELRREEAAAWRGPRDDAALHRSQGPDRNASALEHVWHRMGLHSVAASTSF
jgi:hypothetical protein